MIHNKVVIRAGTGMYYDRARALQLLLPGYAIGEVTGGPFGVNQQVPSSLPKTVPPRACTSTTSPLVAAGNSGSLESPYTNIQNRRLPTLKRPISQLNLPNATSIVKRRAACIPRRVRQQEQTAVHTQLHPRSSVATAQRLGHRARLRWQGRTSPGHSRPVQPAGDCFTHPSAPFGRTTRTATPR